MSAAEHSPLLPESFSGMVRLFPLPDLVVFPHALLPLHVFEPRYRALAEAALADDQLIALATLQPGWEPKYEGQPPIFPTVCLTRIVTHKRLDDGRFALLVAGVQRAQVVRELDGGQPFREARVQLQPDVYPAAGHVARPALHKRLFEAVGELLPELREMGDQLQPLADGELTLGTHTDLLGYALELGIDSKLALLAQPNVDVRAEMIMARLGQLAQQGQLPAARGRFPPDFSLN
jgi:Lon protease-like protein